MSGPSIREPDVLNQPGARRHADKACEAGDRERAFVLASGSVHRETPIVEDVEEALGAFHAGTHVGIGQHAPQSNVEKAIEGADQADADLLVSIGGGSVLDAAKFVQREVSDGWEQPAPAHVAVPTTLSGSEFTILAGWTVEGSDGKPVKTGMSDPRIVPDVALLDAEACSYTPRWLWAATGVRAVDHAAEGITSPDATDEVDERSVRALELFDEHLPAAVDDPDDEEAHTGCLEAGREASAAINYAGSGGGLSHKLGKALGSTWDVPHGVTSALTLPEVVAFEADRRPERTRLVADALGADTAREGVLDLIERVGIEREPLSEYGIEPTDVPWIVEYALGKRDDKVEAMVLDMIDEV
jgi:alcohol dehydrogenase class IV